MTRAQLTEQIFSKKTYLCVGLDTDPERIPKHLRDSPDAVFSFNKAIIDSTKEHCVAYKINTAFYEAHGLKGWEAMERTAAYIPDTHFKIADAKRGDIGNTSVQYARAFFRLMKFDAVTVAPYMGEDSVRPFLEFKNKWTILLGLTSNKGAADFELQTLLNTAATGDGAFAPEEGGTCFLYEKVVSSAMQWGTDENLMFVVGATQSSQLANLRKLAPSHFFLVPGVGAQGGSLKGISKAALTKDCGLLVNASRAIIYASEGEDFADEAAAIAQQYHFEMQQYLEGL
ncbi:MAG TPA: orotidine-5'-phosphate decarboxylase [Flavisolibacter sp.]